MFYVILQNIPTYLFRIEEPGVFYPLILAPLLTTLALRFFRSNNVER